MIYFYKYLCIKINNKILLLNSQPNQREEIKSYCNTHFIKDSVKSTSMKTVALLVPLTLRNSYTNLTLNIKKIKLTVQGC